MCPSRSTDPIPDHFAQLTAVAGLLAAVAGYINAATIAGALHVPSTHMSGTATRLSIDLITQAGPSAVLRDLSLLVAFVVGAAMSGAVLDSTKLRVGRRYGVLLVCEAGLLTVAWGIGTADWFHVPMIALAAGLQNALATQYSRAVVRTTHMTGILTDLGIALGKWISRRGITSWRVVLYAMIFIGFMVGGVAGALLSAAMQANALLVPIAITGVGGGIYWGWRYRAIRMERGRFASELDYTETHWK